MTKNVTLTLDANLLQKVRSKALAQHKNLNLLFREWVLGYVGGGEGRAGAYRELMRGLGHVKAGRRFSRDELNER